jgi:O-acetylhomoserine/O-acetylserine sulfhydrylase-like pyridoxal-dependent enzyme
MRLAHPPRPSRASRVPDALGLYQDREETSDVRNSISREADCGHQGMTHASIPAETRSALGLSDTLIRLSPGCENAQDLVEDILEGLVLIERERATEKAGGGKSAGWDEE